MGYNKTIIVTNVVVAENRNYLVRRNGFMFRLIKKISAVLAAVLCMLSFVTVNAAGGTKINGELDANVGDKFTYSMYMSDCTEGVLGIQMYVFYDQEYLEIDPQSVSFDQFNGAIYNANLEGYMTFNWTNISELADFSSRSKIISMDFTVLKDGNTDITYFIREMYGNNTETLKSYKLTYDLVKDEQVVVSEKTPIVNGSDEVIAEHQGDFINYIDGMGEENSPNKDDHQAHKGEKATMLPAGDSVSTPNDESQATPTTYIIIAGVVLLVMLIGVVLVLKGRSSNN